MLYSVYKYLSIVYYTYKHECILVAKKYYFNFIFSNQISYIYNIFFHTLGSQSHTSFPLTRLLRYSLLQLPLNSHKYAQSSFFYFSFSLSYFITPLVFYLLLGHQAPASILLNTLLFFQLS